MILKKILRKTKAKKKRKYLSKKITTIFFHHRDDIFLLFAYHLNNFCLKFLLLLWSNVCAPVEYIATTRNKQQESEVYEN